MVTVRALASTATMRPVLAPAANGPRFLPARLPRPPGRRPRAQVAGTLWPESTDARALASLRRAVLQTQQQCPGLLQADRTEVGLDPDVEVDVDDVRRAAVLTELPMPGDEAEALLATLVGEPLLPAWYDDWVLPERERLEHARVRAMEQIALKPEA